MPRLRVLAGPSTKPEDLKPIRINDGSTHTIKSDAFEGRVSVFLHYEDSDDASEALAEAGKTYFGHAERRGITWSIQMQGCFLQERSADSVLFGNTFERPLKLPWGTNAVLSFMKYVDPTLEQDLAGPKPWALSPFVCTMPHLRHEHVDPSSAPDTWPAFPPPEPLTAATDFADALSQEPAKRRQHFTAPVLRRTALGPGDLLTSDFCYGFLGFPSLTLKLPGGVSFDCKKYWDGQPVRFVCCEAGDGAGPGRVFWCVAFELEEDEDEADAGDEREKTAGSAPEGGDPPEGNAVGDID